VFLGVVVFPFDRGGSIETGAVPCDHILAGH
jgi:hypothetical protein